jgi:hypothetical protein
MLAWRIILAVSGILLGLFGVYRLLTQFPGPSLLPLLIWLAAALIIHDGLLSPAVVGVGWMLRRFVPDRERRYLQAWLIMSALVVVIALPMIYLRGSQPAVKAILLQDYAANLGLIIGALGVATVALYGRRVFRDRSARPATDQAS